MNRIRASMIAILLFVLLFKKNIYITAISLHLRNDTPRFCHPSSSPNQFVPEIVSPLPCSSELVHHTLLFVYFFKELLSFIGSLDKCHTCVFNVLIFEKDAMYATNFGRNGQTKSIFETQISLM